MDFKGVVEAWQQAPVEAIHPLRSISTDAYWESGRSQALDAARWIPEGGTVLDFGCGDGRLSIPLAQMGYDVYSADASPTMLERLKEQCLKHDVWPSPILSDGTDLWLEEISAVVCRAVLIHHDYDGGSRLVLALAKLLKPGGCLIADWPTGPRYERRDWCDVTTWQPAHRLAVADGASLELVEDATPSVWRKRANV